MGLGLGLGLGLGSELGLGSGLGLGFGLGLGLGLGLDARRTGWWPVGTRSPCAASEVLRRLLVVRIEV